VKSLVAADEPLTPGILYVAVATLTGSIIGRNRSILTRLILPPTLFIASAHQFLPKTSSNVSNYLGSLEDRYTPGLAHVHDTGKAHATMGWAQAKEATSDVRASAEKSLVNILGKVQDATGLKLREVAGWGSEVTAQAKTDLVELKARAVDAVQDVREKAHEAEGDAKLRAREIVDRVHTEAALAEKQGIQAADAVERKVENKRLV
jgi:organizing structure protein 2